MVDQLLEIVVKLGEQLDGLGTVHGALSKQVGLLAAVELTMHSLDRHGLVVFISGDDRGLSLLLVGKDSKNDEACVWLITDLE